MLLFNAWCGGVMLDQVYVHESIQLNVDTINRFRGGNFVAIHLFVIIYSTSYCINRNSLIYFFKFKSVASESYF